MGPFEIFIIRLIIAGIFSFFICRVFFQGVSLIKVSGLASVMLGLAYLFEYLRKRGKGGIHGN